MKLSIWTYVGLSLLLVIVLEGLWIKHQSSELATYRTSVETYKGAQKTNLSTIATCKAANAKWAKDSAEEIANSMDFWKASQQYAQIQQTKAETATTKLRTIYARYPEVKAWSDTPLPPAVVKLLSSKSGSSH